MDLPETTTPRRHIGIRTAGAVVAMVLAGLGIAEAQTGDTTSTTQAPAAAAPGDAARPAKGPGGPVNLSVAASTIGISVEELRTALQSGQSIAQVAQSKNVDVQKVIDALVADAQAKLPEMITQAVNRAGGPGGGPGHHGPGGRGHHGPGGRPNLGVAATALGMTQDELRTALQSGQSIAQVAQSKNVDVQKVIDALVADAKAKLAAEVAAGRLTQAQADEKAANLTQRITDMVNRTGGPGGPGGPGRHGGPPPADGTGPTPSATPAAVA